MSIELDGDRCAKLQILAGLWREGSPAEMVQRFIDDSWRQLGDGIPYADLSIEEFRAVVEELRQLEA